MAKLLNGSGKFLLALVPMAVAGAIGWGTLRATTAHHAKELENLEVKKVDKTEYVECIKRVEQKIDTVDEKIDILILKGE